MRLRRRRLKGAKSPTLKQPLLWKKLSGTHTNLSEDKKKKNSGIK